MNRKDVTAMLAEKYLKQFPTQMRDFEKMPLAKVTSLTESQIVNLGSALERIDDYIKQCEADGNIAHLGKLPNVALDSYTVMVGASPLELIAATQPIDDVQGIVYFRDWVSQSTRGNVTKDQKIFSTLSAPDVYPDGFTTDAFQTSSVITDNGGTDEYNNVNINAGVDYPGPIDPQRCILSGTVVFAAGTCVFANVIPDPETGAFSQMVEAGTSGDFIGMHGVVDFEHCKLTNLKFTATPAAGSNNTRVQVSYKSIPEANVDMQKAILKLQTKPINARFFTLKTTFGLQEQYMLRKRLNVNIEDEVGRDLTLTLNQEVCNTAIKMLVGAVPNGSKNTWERSAGDGSYFEHKMTIDDALIDTDALMVKAAGRGALNCLVAGRKAAAILKSMPGFVKVFDDNSFGAHIYGSYNGIPVVRVPYADVMDELKIVGLHKGSDMEAPLIFSPYMPLVVTPTTVQGYQPLMNMKAAAMWAGLDLLITNFLVELNITETQFAY